MKLTAKRSLRILDFDTENVPGFYWYDEKTTDILHTIAWSFLDQETVDVVTTRYDVKRGLYFPVLGFEKFAADVESADVVTGHNILQHDIPLLNKSALRLGTKPINWKSVNIDDTLPMIPGGGGMPRSQEYLADFFALEERKMHVGLHTWEKAARGDAEASRIVVERCVSDVVSHKKLYAKLRGL